MSLRGVRRGFYCERTRVTRIVVDSENKRDWFEGLELIDSDADDDDSGLEKLMDVVDIGIEKLGLIDQDGGYGFRGSDEDKTVSRSGKTGKNRVPSAAKSKQLFHCKFCSRVFKAKVYLENHVHTHQGERPFECGTCGKTFAWKCSLVRHMVTHSNAKPFGCNVCGKAFSCNEYLKAHRVVHVERLTYQCWVCHKSFKTVKSQKPRDETEPRRLCNICAIAYENRPQYPRKFPEDECCHQCKKCRQRFTSRNALLAHWRCHYLQSPYMCPVCGKSFGSKSNCQNHANTHSGQKLYKCSLCNRSYTRRDNLTYHVSHSH